MKYWLSRCALLPGTAVLVAFVLAGSAGAAVRSEVRPGVAGTTMSGGYSVNLAAYMLDTADLPTGFRPYAPLTGPLDAARARELMKSAVQSAASLVHGYVRDWISAQNGWGVLELVLDSSTRSGASEAVTAFDSSMQAQAAAEQHLTQDTEAFEVPFQLDHVSYVELSAAVARGPFLFRVAVDAPAGQVTQADQLLGTLIARQSSKVPANTPDTGTSLADLEPDTAGAAGYAIGALLGYLAIVNGYAYLRNPLRRKLAGRGQRTAAQWPAGQRVVDVSAPARKYRNVARWRFAAQFAGLAVVAYGAVSFPDTFWYAFPLAGLAIVWASGRLIRPGGPMLNANRRAGSGARRWRVIVYRVVAAATAIAGGLLIAAYALNQETPPAVVAVDVATEPAASQAASVGVATLWAGIVLLAIGAIIARHARRLTAVDAYRLMRQDSRPPVLYLRSFRDDKLKLLSATLGRPSLIERFTPRRFDPFEEVIARHLAGTGPVIALNPPGTKLAPLGAARETLDSDAWQATISDWMAQAALIVLILPPAAVTDGLTWELDTISASQHWAKTLILIPPVPADALSDRWQAFRDAYGTHWPFSVPLTLDGPGPLALTFGDADWTVLSAWRRHEWAYTAAIKGALSLTPREALAGDDR
ncbi:MAG TPA: hypothetical protein VNV62_05705 [Trebonia sp.]|nr:hypothetical protein [Trebonia sp.]